MHWKHLHISVDDTFKALKKHNTNSATGYDYINIKHIKKYKILNVQLLTLLYNCWTYTNHIPSFCKLGVITSFLKKPNGNTPNDFRPITLLPIFFKLFERILLNHLNDVYNLRQNIDPLQGGNRNSRGVPEQLAIVNILSENAKQMNLPLYTALLDIQNRMIFRHHESIRI